MNDKILWLVLDKALKDPNHIGEAHRDFFFVGKGIGCYQDFELREGYTSVDNPKVIKQFKKVMSYYDEPYLNFKLYYYPEFKTYVAWYWDGDGTLLFSNDNYAVMNTDCKKDYEWEFIE